jgi:HEAT repeat protein
VRGKDWLKLAGLSAAMSIAMHCAAPALAAEDPAVAARRELLQQEGILNGGNAATHPAEAARLRDQAAQRLVSRGNAEAHQILFRVLSGSGQRDGQLAVARALASWSRPTDPDPMFIEPLINLLGTDAELTGAVAGALGAYKDNDRVRTRLTLFAGNVTQPVSSRTAVIRAMGRLVDKRAAGTLVMMLNRDENQRIRDAVADALIEMTGLSQHGRDVQRWNLWWDENRNKSEAEWSRDLLYKNASRAGQLAKRLDQVREQAQQLIREDVQARPEAERGQRYVAFLQSEAEDVRWATVQIVYNEVVRTAPKPMPADVNQVLRGMIADASSEVRRAVVQTLGVANDREAVAALLTQLGQEKEPEVRAAIALALGPTHDLTALEPLLARLDDDSFSVARAAADALGEMAPVLRLPDNRELADQAAAQFLRRLRGTDPGQAAFAPLRQSLAQAMGRLGHPSCLSTFYELIHTDREPPLIRISAYRGIGRIGRPDSAGMIIDALQRERDSGVRLEALDALGKTAITFEFAHAIGRLLNEQAEPDATVREKAWGVLEGLLPRAAERDLNFWAERFRGASELDVARRLGVLVVLEKKLDEQKHEERLATCRQNIGETLYRLGRFDDAAASFRLALDYWMSINAGPQVTDLLMQQFMDAQLRARKYAEASTFATAMIQQNAANAEPLWWKIKSEIERLRKTSELDGALLLIEAVRKVPLGPSYASLLDTMEKEIRQLRTRGGMRWVQQIIGTEEYELLKVFITV